ncbi:hypothetical protein D9M70_330180 [compost metagenome]
MNLSLLSRYAFFACCVLFTLLSLPFLAAHEWLWPLALLTGALSLIGLGDLLQTRQAVRRNYPILGNIRYLVEGIRPEIRQYLLEADGDMLPFSRAQRSLVYARAKNESADKPFGTLTDVYQNGFEFIGHSLLPAAHCDPGSFRISIGGPQCAQPYSASVFNISAMSFGSLSANAIRALNQGARLGGFYHDTGEGSISPYHREHGGDLVWELGSGYFGCRTEDGAFDPKRFAEQARNPQVRMIEIKLSQGAKPGHGGILPKHKVTREISLTRGVPMGQDCISPARHSAFATPIELLQFIARLRELSAGKPVGFKLCLGHPWEFMGIAKAMLETMFAIGCIQSQSCHTNKCPTGVATQDPLRQRALVVPDKAQRVANFHRNTLKALAEMIAAAGLSHPSQIEAKHLVRRLSASEIKLYSQLHVFLAPGELLGGDISGEFYRRMWQMARADRFEANPV